MKTADKFNLTVHPGRWVNLIETQDGNLRIQALPAVTEEDWEMLEELPTDEALDWLLEDHFTGGDCYRISPETIGALTDAPILSLDPPDTTQKVYWHDNYQVQDPIQALREHHAVTFKGDSTGDDVAAAKAGSSKVALDALLEELNNKFTTVDHRNDKEYEHPFGSKGTEPESGGGSDGSKQGSRIAIARFLTVDEVRAVGRGEKDPKDVGILCVGGVPLHELIRDGKLAAIPNLNNPAVRGMKPSVRDQALLVLDMVSPALEAQSEVGATDSATRDRIFSICYNALKNHRMPSRFTGDTLALYDEPTRDESAQEIGKAIVQALRGVVKMSKLGAAVYELQVGDEVQARVGAGTLKGTVEAITGDQITVTNGKITKTVPRFDVKTQDEIAGHNREMQQRDDAEEAHKKEVILPAIAEFRDRLERIGDLSCWGCGKDWRSRWSADDLAPVRIDGDRHFICPDCVEEVGPDTLDFQAKEASKEVTCHKCGKKFDSTEDGHESENKWFCNSCSKQARKPMHDDSGARTGLRRRPDYGESDSYTSKMNDANSKSAAAKPKCPHCGSTEYGLMPSDFETAKCDKCGKNWDHGIVPGINDPKTAGYVRVDSAAHEMLRFLEQAGGTLTVKALRHHDTKHLEGQYREFGRNVLNPEAYISRNFVPNLGNLLQLGFVNQVGKDVTITDAGRQELVRLNPLADAQRQKYKDSQPLPEHQDYDKPVRAPYASKKAGYIELQVKNLLDKADEAKLKGMKFSEDVYDYLMTIHEQLIRELMSKGFEEVGEIDPSTLMDWCDNHYPGKPAKVEGSENIKSDQQFRDFIAQRNAAAKIRWKVDSAPTGRYRSFDRRGWPSAEYANGDIAAMIQCPDEYIPSNVKEGKHAPLTVLVADWNRNAEERKAKGAFGWRKLKGTFATLKEAQAATAKIIDEHPELHPQTMFPRTVEEGKAKTEASNPANNPANNPGNNPANNPPHNAAVKTAIKDGIDEGLIEMHGDSTLLPPRIDQRTHMDDTIKKDRADELEDVRVHNSAGPTEEDELEQARRRPMRTENFDDMEVRIRPREEAPLPMKKIFGPEGRKPVKSRMAHSLFADYDEEFLRDEQSDDDMQQVRDAQRILKDKFMGDRDVQEELKHLQEDQAKYNIENHVTDPNHDQWDMERLWKELGPEWIENYMASGGRI